MPTRASRLVRGLVGGYVAVGAAQLQDVQTYSATCGVMTSNEWGENQFIVRASTVDLKVMRARR